MPLGQEDQVLYKTRELNTAVCALLARLSPSGKTLEQAVHGSFLHLQAATVCFM